MLKKPLGFDLIVIFAAGILIGLLTSFGQSFIPDPFRQLANSYSVWLFGSFVTALFLHRYRTAVIGGAVVQYLAIATYYAISSARFDSGFSLASNVIWIAGGTVAGPVAGFLGQYVKNKVTYKFIVPAFVSGLFFSESAYECINLKYFPEGYIFAAIGLVVFCWLVYRYKISLFKSFLATIVSSTLMYVAYGVVLVTILG